MTDVVKKIISINPQKNGAIVGVAGAKALSASEYIDEKHSLSSLNSDQSVVDINSLKDKYDDINYYDGDGVAPSNSGTVSSTLGAATLSSSGALTDGATGTLSRTLGPLTLSSTGGVPEAIRTQTAIVSTLVTSANFEAIRTQTAIVSTLVTSTLPEAIRTQTAIASLLVAV